MTDAPQAEPWIPLAAPDLSGNEERYVVDAVRSSWISSSGPYVDRFEREFADACGSESAVAVTNGTVALHLAMLGLDVGPGDEVIVPSLTYVAVANAVKYVGGEPVFVDVDPKTWCLDPELVKARINERTVGIVAVHNYGHPADMDPLLQLADRAGLWVVEDAAEAHFARYRGRVVGSLATIGTFSFYGNKILSSGEGGAVTVSQPDLERKLRLLRGQGMDPNNRYFFPVVGHNFRATNIVCALLCAQLERADEMMSVRRSLAMRYHEMLGQIGGVAPQPIADWAEPAPWLANATVDPEEFGINSVELRAGLARAGVETRPFFVPLHTLPPYIEQSRARGERLPVTEELGSRGVSLPLFSGMTHDAVERICELISRARP